MTSASTENTDNPEAACQAETAAAVRGEREAQPAKKTNPSKCPPHNSQWLWQWMVEEKHDEITEHFIRVLEYLSQHVYSRSTYNVTRFVNDFLYVMGNPAYVISPQYLEKMILLNPVIANVVAMTPHETTDHCIEIAKYTKNNIGKICVLYSPRNRSTIDRMKIVDANPRLASLWYSAYMRSYPTAPADPVGLQHLREHIRFIDDRLDLTLEPQLLYYGATYVDQENDKLIKRRINEALQRGQATIQMRYKPNTNERPRIAVISDFWRKSHSSCRIQMRWIEALKGAYHLTLVHVGHRDPKTLDTSLFDEVLYIGNPRGGVNIKPIKENDFDLVYFSDVGMTSTSIALANLRIAPIQVLGPGHPVSSWGAELDYFISGTENELPQDAQANYSEKLLLLPGMGATHNPILHPRQNRSPSTDPLIINCPWSPQKINYELLQMLAMVTERTQVRLVFRFFTAGIDKRQCAALPFRRSLERVLGAERIEVQNSLKYASYMDMLEEGAFTLDSYPYGGGNVIADSLYMRRPIVCLEGKHWYNRMGPAMLRRVGLADLVASSPEEFVDKICGLVQDPAARSRYSSLLDDNNLNANIFNDDLGPHFKRLIDKIIAEHPRLS